jgi:hypothetical protein
MGIIELGVGTKSLHQQLLVDEMLILISSIRQFGSNVKKRFIASLGCGNSCRDYSANLREK